MELDKCRKHSNHPAELLGMPLSEDDGLGGVRGEFLAGQTAIPTGDFGGSGAGGGFGTLAFAALGGREYLSTPLFSTYLRGCQAHTSGTLEPDFRQRTAAFKDDMGDVGKFPPDAWQGLAEQGSVGKMRRAGTQKSAVVVEPGQSSFHSEIHRE